MLFPTVSWPMTSALVVNLAYLYTLLLCTFFSSLYYNVVIQSTLLQHCDNIYNKELLIIITVLKEWRAFLQGIIELFIIKTDYKNLIGFLTTKELN